MNNTFINSFFASVIFSLICHVAYSQEMVNIHPENENRFLVRVKQFNEFIDRFNYKTDFKGNLIDSSFMTAMPRGKMLVSLFDFNDTRIDRNGTGYSQEYSENVSGFINTVSKDNLIIDKYSPSIIAEARSRVTYHGKQHIISVYLVQEITGNDMVKWAILDVSGEMLDFSEKDTTNIRFISPGSNETDFINLKRALRDTGYLQYYASESYTPDMLSIFFYCIHNGIITFDYVEDVTYHILDIPGWVFKVREFNRNTLNSGWLITDLSENHCTRKDYLLSLRHNDR